MVKESGAFAEWFTTYIHPAGLLSLWVTCLPASTQREFRRCRRGSLLKIWVATWALGNQPWSRVAGTELQAGHHTVQHAWQEKKAPPSADLIVLPSGSWVLGAVLAQAAGEENMQDQEWRCLDPHLHECFAFLGCSAKEEGQSSGMRLKEKLSMHSSSPDGR
jgi:hypothetical protein